MARVLAEMEHPLNQYLLIHLFVRRTAKAQALWSLYPHNNTGRQGGLGFARLHYALVTHPHTVIFIDGLLYRRLLLPHADTWTLFADDIGGICQVKNLLTAWCAALSSDALEPTCITQPRLIIILTDPQDTAGPLETLESTLRAVAIASLVASVCVLDLRDRALLSLVSCFELLRRLLSQELDKAYLTQRQAHELFSAIHLDWIWRKSLYHVARQPTAPFDCIRACHPNQPPEDQASRYLRLFLDTADWAGAATDTVILYIASALLMDAYLPGMHAPEHILPCEHAICDICVQIFGARSQGAEYHFELRSCPLCLARFSCIARVLPPTKQLTILALDGGGVRGVVTLGFLAALEERIGGSRGLREAFDLNLGTSVGAVIVSEVIDLGRLAAVAHAKFRALARQIFRPRPPQQTILAQMWDLLTTWVSNSRHDSNTLDRALQQAFDPARRLFGLAAPLVSGVRVALTASQVDNNSLLGLFCNYRGAGCARMQSAYKLFLPEEREPLLWEVARYSVAALSISLGSAPSRTAVSELAVPSAPPFERPDLVISVRTGYAVGEAPMMTEPGRRWLRDGFIDRALQTFLYSPAVNGRRGWQDALDTIPGKAPELNDIRALNSLRDFAYTVPDELV
ncbi:hypothetical protein KXX32_008997 [Aspergillus fumigatus]|nr:hypothetical protein KXX32_008997 [Aspergillus fumigatus]